MTIRILHFSDSHIQPSNVAVLKVRIEAMCAACAGPQIDAVLFSGDATASGTEEQFGLFEGKVVKPTLDALGLSPDLFFIVPGNHDVERTKLNRLLRPGIREAIKDPDEADKLWSDPANREALAAGLVNFNAFVARSGVKADSGVIRGATPAIGVACINSALVSGGDDDRHHLVITRAQWDQATQSAGEASVMVGLWHHPFDWLHDSDNRRILERAISGMDLCAIGHFHEDQGQSIATPFGECRVLQAPAMHARGAQAGFLVYELDPVARSGVAHCWCWDDRRAVFVPNGAFAPGGKWPFALPSRSGLDPKTSIVHSRAYQRQQANAVGRLERHLPVVTSASGPLAIEDRFLSPNLLAVNASVRKKVSVSDLLKGNKSTLITGDRHAGKSTLLDYALFKLNAGGRLAVAVGFRGAAEYPGRAGLASLVAKACGEPKAQIEKLLDAGLTVAVDDVEATEGNRDWQALSGWFAEAPNVRFLLAMRVVGGLPESLDTVALKCRVLSLNPLDFKSVKAEVERINQRAPAQVGRWDLRKTLDTIIEAELPRWPWVILILLELGIKGTQVDVTNLAALLRAYADLRLGAFDAGGGEGAKVRGGILKLLASEMSKASVDSIKRDAALTLSQAEMTAAGVPGAADDVIESLVRAGILLSEGDELRFAFFVFQEFFFAERLVEQRWADVEGLTGDSIIRIGSALVFLSETIQLPGLVEKAFLLAEESSPKPAKVLKLEDLSRLSALLDYSDAEEGVAGARAAVPNDAAVEDSYAGAEKSRADVKRTRLTRGADGLHAINLFREHVFVAIALLRSNMWLRVDNKRAAVQKSVDLASRLAAEMALNEDVLRFLAPPGASTGDKALIISVMNAVLLMVVGAMVAAVGSARHLTSAIMEVFDSEADDLKRLFLVMWYSEAGGADSAGMVRRYVERATTVSALQLAEMWMTMRLINSWTFGGSSAEQDEQLLREIATTRLAQMGAGSGPGAAKDKAEKIVQGVRRERMKSP